MEHYLKTRIGIMAILCSMSLTQSCYAQEDTDPIPKESMDRVKKVYEFEKWAGKVKAPNMKVAKLRIDPNLFDVFSKKTQIYTDKPQRERRLSISIIDKKTDLGVDIDIGIKEDPLAVHKGIINYLSLVTAPPPVFRRIDPNDPNAPLNIGDLCFVSMWTPQKSKKPVVRTLLFCRNNAGVILRNSHAEDKEAYPDLGEIAFLIDKKLIEISKAK